MRLHFTVVMPLLGLVSQQVVEVGHDVALDPELHDQLHELRDVVFPGCGITETFLLSSCFGNCSLATARSTKSSYPSQTITFSVKNSSLENS